MPFIPRGKKKMVQVALPETKKTYKHKAFEVCGDSLTGARIQNGDYLTYRKCEKWEIQPGKLFIIYIISTSDLIPRYIKINPDESVTLQAANPAYQDRTYEPHEIEVRGICVGCTFNLL